MRDRKSERRNAVITGRQIAAARALVGWSQVRLAQEAALHVNAVRYWEAHEQIPHQQERLTFACQRIERALLDAGVCFTNSPTAGVRFVEK